MNLVRQLINLLPDGRAFVTKDGTNRFKFLKAIAHEFQEAVDYLDLIAQKLIPDNDDFTEQDAKDWELRLGMFVKEDNPLQIRKDAIYRKMSQPGTVLPKNSPQYIQRELQAAGFDVYVVPNRFPDGTGGFEPDDPADLQADQYFDESEQFDSPASQFGRIRTGGSSVIVANSIDPNGADFNYEITDPVRLRFTFFIGGPEYPDRAEVPANRENEFRQLILALKPSHTVALLNINYV